MVLALNNNKTYVSTLLLTRGEMNIRSASAKNVKKNEYKDTGLEKQSEFRLLAHWRVTK